MYKFGDYISYRVNALQQNFLEILCCHILSSHKSLKLKLISENFLFSMISRNEALSTLWLYQSTVEDLSRDSEQSEIKKNRYDQSEVQHCLTIGVQSMHVKMRSQPFLAAVKSSVLYSIFYPLKIPQKILFTKS